LGRCTPKKVPVIETNLANGMRLLIVERHDEPALAGGWVAHVGSSNERPGITGIAYLFEHMMFKGTPTIGTKNSIGVYLVDKEANHGRVSMLLPGIIATTRIILPRW